MGNNKVLGIALLVIGIILLVFGFNASQSLGEQMAESFTGRFSDQTMWYLIAGAASVVVGAVLTLRK
ncbi:MAG TPA: DUF3185 family protein [Methylophaga sp.]|nr:DUF3185 family protein [Methylophaga sp.]